jgi:16S rRNA pseudouridine516 synthase
MELQKILFSQGFGTRRVCAGLIQQGYVQVQGEPCTDASAQFEPEGLVFTVQGVEWTYYEKAYLMLHKPAGYECSHKPGAWPSVYTLLPAPLRQRPNSTNTLGVQAIGRLDQDTTGLLLFCDAGAFIHKLCWP